MTDPPEPCLRTCCIPTDLRRRVAERRADELLGAVARIAKARTLEQAKRAAEDALTCDGALYRFDWALEREQIRERERASA